MFPIHLKLTISTPAELARVTAFIGGDYTATVAASPKLGVSADEKAAVVSSTACDDQHAPDPTAAPGKSTSAATVDKPARGQRTAAAAAATAAPEKTVAEQTHTAASAEAAPQASTAADAFDYAVLQKAVNAAVPKHGREKLAAIANAHGAPNFKGLDASKWAAAHADVVALG